MTARCSTCKNFSLKASPHRNLGLYNCKAMPQWQYPNPFIERECAEFREVPAEQLQARLDWEKTAGPMPSTNTAKEAKKC